MIAKKHKVCRTRLVYAVNKVKLRSNNHLLIMGQHSPLQRTLLAFFSLIFFLNTSQAQWKLRLHTWMLTRQGGTIPLYIQYVDHTNTLGVYGDFDSAVADGVYKLPNLGNTATLTDKGWANAGFAYNYAGAYSYVYFHNKLFGED